MVRNFKIRLFFTASIVSFILFSGFQNCAVHQSTARKFLDSKGLPGKTTDCLPYLSSLDVPFIFSGATYSPDPQMSAVEGTFGDYDKGCLISKSPGATGIDSIFCVADAEELKALNNVTRCGDESKPPREFSEWCRPEGVTGYGKLDVLQKYNEALFAPDQVLAYSETITQVGNSKQLTLVARGGANNGSGIGVRCFIVFSDSAEFRGQAQTQATARLQRALGVEIQNIIDRGL